MPSDIFKYSPAQKCCNCQRRQSRPKKLQLNVGSSVLLMVVVARQSTVPANSDIPFVNLQNCLITIYLAYVSGNTELLERLVGTVLGFVQVPPSGGPKLTFSIGAGDRQTLCPSASQTLPVTGKSVAGVFNQLGEYSVHSGAPLNQI